MPTPRPPFRFGERVVIEDEDLSVVALNHDGVLTCLPRGGGPACQIGPAMARRLVWSRIVGGWYLPDRGCSSNG